MWKSKSFFKKDTWLSTATKKSFRHVAGRRYEGCKVMDPPGFTFMILLRGGGLKSYISESHGSLKSWILPKTAFRGVTIFNSNLYAVPVIYVDLQITLSSSTVHETKGIPTSYHLCH